MAGYREKASVRPARLSSLCQVARRFRKLIPVPCHFSPLAHVSPLHSRFERSNGRLIVLRDISGRKQTEAERERLKE